MRETVSVKNIGLRGVKVADTKISFIDGEKGILIYRGYRIEELAERSSFMETAYLALERRPARGGAACRFDKQVRAAQRNPRLRVWLPQEAS